MWLTDGFWWLVFEGETVLMHVSYALLRYDSYTYELRLAHIWPPVKNRQKTMITEKAYRSPKELIPFRIQRLLSLLLHIRGPPESPCQINIHITSFESISEFLASNYIHKRSIKSVGKYVIGTFWWATTKESYALFDSIVSQLLNLNQFWWKGVRSHPATVLALFSSSTNHSRPHENPNVRLLTLLVR